MENKTLTELEEELNRLGVYSKGTYNNLDESEEQKKNEPQIPNFNTTERWAEKRFKEIKTEVIKERNKEQNVVDENVVIAKIENNYSEVVSKSVGKTKVIKTVIKVILAAGLVTGIALGGININNENKLENYRENYVNMEDFVVNTEDGQFYELEETGRNIAFSIIEKSTTENFDISREMVLGLGLACEQVNEMHPLGEYNINKAYDYEELSIEHEGWVEQIYGSMRSTLEQAKIVNLPTNLKDCLVEFGFDKGIYSCNFVTGELKFTPKENVSDKEMIKNLIAYASSIGITNGREEGGRPRG